VHGGMFGGLWSHECRGWVVVLEVHITLTLLNEKDGGQWQCRPEITNSGCSVTGEDRAGLYSHRYQLDFRSDKNQ